MNISNWSDNDKADWYGRNKLVMEFRIKIIRKTKGRSEELLSSWMWEDHILHHQRQNLRHWEGLEVASLSPNKLARAPWGLILQLKIVSKSLKIYIFVCKSNDYHIYIYMVCMYIDWNRVFTDSAYLYLTS